MAEPERSRTVRLILCSAAGDVLGALEPFPVGEPWWPEVAEIVAAAEQRVGVRIVVLRLLAADVSRGMEGGDVTYLAELVGDRPAELRLEPVDPGESRSGRIVSACRGRGRAASTRRSRGRIDACVRSAARARDRPCR